MLRHLCLFLLLIVFINVMIIDTNHAQTVEITTALSIDNVTIQTETPLIKKDGVIFAPIRDITRQLKGTFTYYRRDNSYLITLKPNDLLIIPFSRECWINQKSFYLEKAPMFYQNNLYVPLKETFSYIGYSVTETSSSIRLNRSSTRPSSPQKPLHTPSSIDVISTDTHTHTEHSHLPFIGDYKGIVLAFADNIYDISDTHFYKDKTILFVDILPILKKEGYTVSESSTSFTLSRHKDRTTFFKHERRVNRDNSINTWQQSIEHDLVKKGDTYFFPLKSTLTAMDLSMKWLPRERKINVLNTILSLKLNKKNDRYYLDVLAALPLSPNDIDTTLNGNSYLIDVPFTQSTAPSLQINDPKSPFSQITVKNTSESGSEIQITFKEALGYPLASEIHNGAQFTFNTTITDLKEKKHKDKITISILGKGIHDYKIRHYKAPDRLLVDIPNAVTKLPLLIRSNTAAYSKIRTSLYQRRPPRTRIVFDLKNKDALMSHRLKDGQIELIFSNKRQQHITKQPALPVKGIKGKVIAIDAGHGGRDPGAVGKNKDFEKKYTLDIAKRMERKLSAAGADVIMTRSGDQNTKLYKRAQIANKNNADIFISIHINSFYTSKAKGTETYYFKYKDKPLASALQKEMVTALKRRNNGIKRSKLYVLNHTKMPAALVEPMFMTHPEEYRQIRDPNTRERIANALVTGISNYFN